MAKKGTNTKAEFVNLLSSVLTHPQCPGVLFDAITDALIEMQNAAPTPWASKEYIRYSLLCYENARPEPEEVEDLEFNPESETDTAWPALKLIKGVQ